MQYVRRSLVNVRRSLFAPISSTFPPVKPSIIYYSFSTSSPIHPSDLESKINELLQKDTEIIGVDVAQLLFLNLKQIIENYNDKRGTKLLHSFLSNAKSKLVEPTFHELLLKVCKSLVLKKRFRESINVMVAFCEPYQYEIQGLLLCSIGDQFFQPALQPYLKRNFAMLLQFFDKFGSFQFVNYWLPYNVNILRYFLYYYLLKQNVEQVQKLSVILSENNVRGILNQLTAGENPAVMELLVSFWEQIVMKNFEKFSRVLNVRVFQQVLFALIANKQYQKMILLFDIATQFAKEFSCANLELILEAAALENHMQKFEQVFNKIIITKVAKTFIINKVSIENTIRCLAKNGHTKWIAELQQKYISRHPPPYPFATDVSEFIREACSIL